LSTALFAFDRPEAAQRAAQRLREGGLPPESITLHMPHDSPGDRSAAAFDEQATGGLLTNVSRLFGEVFEWGSLPIDASAYAATVRHGGAALSVHAVSQAQRSSVDALMSDTQPRAASGWFSYPAERSGIDG